VSLYSTPESIERCGGDASLRWSRYLRGGFELVGIEGKHMELFDPPNVGPVTSVLARSLAAARSRAMQRFSN
jgi:hypothetical protein